MDINAYFQNVIKEKKEELDQHLQSADERIAQARARLEAIKARTDFPEKTDTLAKLEKSSGRTVQVYSQFGIETTPYEFVGGRINTRGVSYPLIGEKGHGVERMVDAESGEVIFNNPCYHDEIAVQYGMLLGREAAVKEAEAEVDSQIKSKEFWENDYKETLEAIEKVPAWIEKGEKLIFPQRAGKWEECVAKRATALYKGLELNNALEIMETLANGGTVEQAKEILDKANHSGTSYTITMGIIANFSKRGPEFYREVEHENPDWLQKIERENQTFEKELSGGGKQ